MTEGLIKVYVQGKHRYYSLEGPNVARALEALSILAGGSRNKFEPKTPSELRFARTCYDHMAGTASVLLHNHFKTLGWLLEVSTERGKVYELSSDGRKVFETLGIDIDTTRALRRRFAYACLDWSERQPHIGGAFGAAFLEAALKRKWVERNAYDRTLNITNYGKREILARFGLKI
jgi:hypothetical protein